MHSSVKRGTYDRPNYTHRDVPLSALLLFALISYWHTDAKFTRLLTERRVLIAIYFIDFNDLEI